MRITNPIYTAMLVPQFSTYFFAVIIGFYVFADVTETSLLRMSPNFFNSRTFSHIFLLFETLRTYFKLFLIGFLKFQKNLFDIFKSNFSEESAQGRENKKN